MVDVGATGATACDRVGIGCGRDWRRRRRRAGTELQTEVRSRLRVLALGAGCSRSRVGQDGGSGFLGSHGQSWEWDRNTRPMRQMGCDGSEMKSFPKCLRWKRPWVNCCSSHLVMRAPSPRRNPRSPKKRAGESCNCLGSSRPIDWRAGRHRPSPTLLGDPRRDGFLAWQCSRAWNLNSS